MHEEIKNIHGKKLVIVIQWRFKLIRLAPAYDIVSTIVYETSTEKMALRVGDAYKLSDIRKGDFEKEAKKVGLGKIIAMKDLIQWAEIFKSNQWGKWAIDGQGISDRAN